MPRAIVAGGSLGGLTAALVVRDAGFTVDVFERASKPLEGRGAGIVLHPASIRYLRRADGPDLEEFSSHAGALRYLDRSGSVLHEAPCSYRFTSYFTLHQELLRFYDPTNYRLGHRVVGFTQDGDRVTARLADGREEGCDLLVCADGIHSGARQALLPESRSHYAGYVGWRGTVPERELEAATRATLVGAITYAVLPHSHILVYPIPNLDGSLDPGRRLINFVWYLNCPEADLAELLTDRSGIRHEVSLAAGAVQERHVQALRATAEQMLSPQLAELVAKSREPFVQAVFDIGVPRMAFGRICLIGDAAFALRPHVAAGTAKAAHDAWTLGEALSSGGSVPDALRRWEPEQLRTARAAAERAREAGERAQFEGTWRVGDPLPFGLHVSGDSRLP